jgi:membrane carboxypeptidase/penicillin-binding protein
MSPIEVARAYATLANGGRRSTPRTFVDVVQAGGLAHEHNPLVGPVRAVDPATAYLMTSLLQGVVARGTAVRVSQEGMSGAIAGKTGTTDDEYDLWFVGFTPELVAVVWVGYDEPRTVGVPSSQGALPIWTSFMQEVVGSRVRGAFPRPGEVEELDIDPESGALALRGCDRSQKEFFIRGTEPETTCPPDARLREDDRRPGVFRRTFGRLFGN